MISFYSDTSNVLCNILETFGPQDYNQMQFFFQTKSERDQFKKLIKILKTCKSSNIILQNNTIKMVGYEDTELNSTKVKKCIDFLIFLFKVKDDNNKFLYFHSIEYADININFPDVMQVKINGMWITIQYCSKEQLDDYNYIMSKRMSKENWKNEKYILVTEPDVNIESVNFDNIINIAIVSDSKKVEIIK